MINVSASKTLLFTAILVGALGACLRGDAASERPQTGQVANQSTSSFKLGGGPSAPFIFGDQNGAITVWNSGTGAAAAVEAAISGASFNGPFANVNAAGEFVDPYLPTGYVPFDVQDIGGAVYVTYAPAGQAARVARVGFVDAFDQSGKLLHSVVNSGALPTSWGLAVAPTGFGTFGLAGDFGAIDSAVSVLNPNGTHAGARSIAVASGPWPGGLWALDSPEALSFSYSETDGSFGMVTILPEISTWAMMFAGLAGLGLVGLRRRRKPSAAVE